MKSVTACCRWINHSNSTGKTVVVNKEIRKKKNHRVRSTGELFSVFTEKVLGRFRSRENYHDTDEKKEDLQQHIQGISKNFKKSCKMEKNKETLK